MYETVTITSIERGFRRLGSWTLSTETALSALGRIHPRSGEEGSGGREAGE
jgi:hypothetical protein